MIMSLKCAALGLNLTVANHVIFCDLCGPVSNVFIPFIDIPNDLKQIIECCSYFIDGGYDYNGKVIAELETKENETKIDTIVADIKSKNLK